MTLEQAIRTAIGFEHKVRDAYKDAAQKATDPVGRKVFETLAREEQGHVDYLESRLTEWQKTGHVTAAKLATIIPPADAIDAAIKAATKPLQQYDHKNELQMLQKALEMETETGAFYERMVQELPAGEREVFQRFLEIEAGHQKIVQSEIDAVTGLGYWFGIPEFALEAE